MDIAINDIQNYLGKRFQYYNSNINRKSNTIYTIDNINTRGTYISWNNRNGGAWYDNSYVLEYFRKGTWILCNQSKIHELWI